MTLSPNQFDSSHIHVRHPSVSDGAAIWELVGSTQVLEPNTCYAYLLLATHFADTCLVAESDGHLIGFVAAYRPPTKPGVVFVWQIGVSHVARGRGLAKRLLHDLVDLPACEAVTHLEATVAATNEPSLRLFSGFARERGVPCERGRGFEAADFSPLTHESEALLRIGPLRRDP
ncbi:MAG: L-2,4-diaminobutyric acid acetyltransferase [Myxococcota bacterium]|jgi:L-2,4-diaminobutyric acid acetyltransferase